MLKIGIDSSGAECVECVAKHLDNLFSKLEKLLKIPGTKAKSSNTQHSFDLHILDFIVSMNKLIKYNKLASFNNGKEGKKIR